MLKSYELIKLYCLTYSEFKKIMKYIFWICWTGEMIAVLCWIGSEMKLQYLKPNPFSFLSALYLLTVLAVRFGAGAEKLSAWMVILPALPLLLMMLFVIIHTISGGRWN